MGANAASYLPAEIAAVFEVDARRGDLALGFDSEQGAIRLRLTVAHARYLALRLRDELAAYDLNFVQSPMSSGMPISDGSPIEGQSV